MKPRLFSVDEVLVVARYVRALRQYLIKTPEDGVDRFAELVAERERCLRWVYFHGDKLTTRQYDRVRAAMRNPDSAVNAAPTRAERAAINKKESGARYIKPVNYTKKERALIRSMKSSSGTVQHIRNTNLGHATGSYK